MADGLSVGTLYATLKLNRGPFDKAVEFMYMAYKNGYRRLGFTGGRVLEPGMGTGLFFALLPALLRPACQLTGIEYDPVTARIARLVHPEARVRCEDYTRSPLAGGFDLAIGHGSNDITVAAALLRIPCTTTFDYEWATVQHNVNCRLAQAVVVPVMIPFSRLRFGVEKLVVLPLTLAVSTST